MSEKKEHTPIEEAADDYACVMVWINKGQDNEQEFYEYISKASFKAGAEWAASQEVKGNATQQGFPEYLTTLAHQYATDSEWGYPDDKAGRWMFEVVKQVFKDGYCRALTDNSLLPEKPNSSTSPEQRI